jgi:hypothetical protein
VRQLFHYAGAWTPDPAPEEFGWEAAGAERLIGGVLVEGRGEHGFIHGPVVVNVPEGIEPLDVADQLVAPLLEVARARALRALYTRPQGLDRVWVRHGFVPMPEAALPEGLRGRPGTGLHAWRRPGTYAVPTPSAESRRRAR